MFSVYRKYHVLISVYETSPSSHDIFWIFKLWSDFTLTGELDVNNGDIISKIVY